MVMISRKQQLNRYCSYLNKNWYQKGISCSLFFSSAIKLCISSPNCAQKITIILSYCDIANNTMIIGMTNKTTQPESSALQCVQVVEENILSLMFCKMCVSCPTDFLSTVTSSYLLSLQLEWSFGNVKEKKAVALHNNGFSITMFEISS